jgi:uncharacterized BrkB/YihY/UPF0761 family membrane protein
VQQRLASLADRRDTVKPIDVTLRLGARPRSRRQCSRSGSRLPTLPFFLPVLLLLVGLLDVTGISAGNLAEDAGVGTALATEIDKGVERSGAGRWLAVAAGAVGALWAGRSLTKVLVASATLAWQVDPPRRAGTSLIAVAVVYGIAWFLVSLLLPRATSDPSALLPGAVLAGVVMVAVQAFTQLYLPDKLAQASVLFGGFGVAVVTLGSLFLFGRVLVGASLVNAIAWERFGSIAGFVFGLPGIRRLARRFPTLVRFFDLDPTSLARRTQNGAESSAEE